MKKIIKIFLEAEVYKRRLTKHIIFIEQTINIEDYYLITDVGISSSKQGFSNSVLEFLHLKNQLLQRMSNVSIKCQYLSFAQ